MFKSILVPTDGSDVSAKATKQAIAIAKGMKAKVVGVHVSPEFHTILENEYMGPVPMMSRREFNASAKAAGEKHLESVARAAKSAGVPFESVVVAADRVHEALIKTAKKKKCDLIIIASHGRTGLSSLILGSVTQRVLSHSNIPVLVLR